MNGTDLLGIGLIVLCLVMACVPLFWLRGDVTETNLKGSIWLSVGCAAGIGVGIYILFPEIRPRNVFWLCAVIVVLEWVVYVVFWSMFGGVSSDQTAANLPDTKEGGSQ